MKIFIGLLITLCHLCEFGRNCESDGIQYHLGSKTAYRFVANLNSTKLQFDGCVPQKIWMIVRHGTRNPSANFIEKFSTRLPEIRDTILERNSGDKTDGLFKSQLEEFKKWNYELTASDAKKLNNEGKREMIDLAERMQNRFPDLLPAIYSNTSYNMRFTHTQRAKKSAKFFSVGLFGKKTAKDVWFPEPLGKDLVLRFYKLCDRWQQEVKKNLKTYEERNKFASGHVMQNARKKITKKLNLKEDLSFEDLHYMYSACAFEKSTHRKKNSPWCYVFDDETIAIMEFSEYLKYYWVDMYGYELTYKQACPTFNDMVRHLDGKDNYPKATVYFTHSGTLLKLLAHLGLYKLEKPLTHNDYGTIKSDNYGISKIDPFGNNLAFASYKCGDVSKLLVLHQERIVRLPSCPDNDLCDFDAIKDYYKESLKSCNFEQMCKS